MSSTSAGGNRPGSGAQLHQAVIRHAQVKKAETQTTEPKAQEAAVVDSKQNLKTEKQEILKRNSIAREGVDRSKTDRSVKQQVITKKTTQGELPDAAKRVNFNREEEDPLYVNKRGRKTAAGLWNEEKWGLLQSLSAGELPAVAKVEKGFHDLRVLEQGVISMRKQAGEPRVHGGIADVSGDGKVLYKPAAPAKTQTQLNTSQASELYAQQIGIELGLKAMPWQFA